MPHLTTITDGTLSTCSVYAPEKERKELVEFFVKSGLCTVFLCLAVFVWTILLVKACGRFKPQCIQLINVLREKQEVW